MRLICPNCGATYEVDATLIPAAGRDVQCSNCGHGWFQHPDDMRSGDPDEETRDPAENELEDEAETDIEAERDGAKDAGPAAPRRRELDPEIADVLREEARREAEARKSEARRAESAGTLESQPDFGLDDTGDRAASRSAAARARMARLRGIDDGEPASETQKGHGADVLPDVDEINSTLRGQDDRAEITHAPVPVSDGDPEKRGGFRAGFLIVVVLCAIAVAVYALAPRIADAVPEAAPYLTAYVDWVNDLRGQINGLVDKAVVWVREMTAGIFG